MAERAEFYYQKDEFLKKIKAFLKVHHSLIGNFGQFSERSPFSAISMQHVNNVHNIIPRVISPDQSDSNPESGTDHNPLPEKERNDQNSILHPLPLGQTEQNHYLSDEKISHCTSDHNFLDGGTDTKRNQIISCEEMIREWGKPTDSLGAKIRSSEQMLQLIEENCSHLNELIRRNEEKREVIRELRNRAEKLAKMNWSLQNENRRLMDENWDLAVSLEKATREKSKAPGFLKSCRFRRKICTSISRFKALIMNSFRVASCHSN